MFPVFVHFYAVPIESILGIVTILPRTDVTVSGETVYVVDADDLTKMTEAFQACNSVEAAAEEAVCGPPEPADASEASDLTVRPRASARGRKGRGKSKTPNIPAHVPVPEPDVSATDHDVGSAAGAPLRVAVPRAAGKRRALRLATLGSS